jgi:hypothetical protein
LPGDRWGWGGGAPKVTSVATLAIITLGAQRWVRRTQLRSNLRLRHARLRFFSKPIFVASMLSVVGNLAADAIVEDASVLLRAWLWLVLL